MLLLLQHHRPDGDVDTYHLKPGRRFHIGRGSACEVRILDLKLSRSHAAVEYRADSWWLLDLGSTNGCTLDGRPLDSQQETPLSLGSVIEMGTTRLITAEGVIAAQGPASRTRTPLPAGEAELASAPNHVTSALEARHERNDAPTSEPSPRPRTDEIPAPHTAIEVKTDSTVPKVSAPVVQAPIQIQVPDAQAASMTVASADRAYFITVLGRRIGPLGREQARDLKARELKGILRSEDLDGLPQG